MVAWTPLVDMRLELGAMERIERERGCAWRRKEMVNYLLSESYIIFYTCI